VQNILNTFSVKHSNTEALESHFMHTFLKKSLSDIPKAVMAKLVQAYYAINHHQNYYKFR